MKRYTWLPIITLLAYCVNRELYDAISCQQTQVDVLIEHQAKPINALYLLPHNGSDWLQRQRSLAVRC